MLEIRTNPDGQAGGGMSPSTGRWGCMLRPAGERGAVGERGW